MEYADDYQSGDNLIHNWFSLLKHSVTQADFISGHGKKKSQVKLLIAY